ncbi:MAG: DUF4175 domain-containing protein [Planctomycetes bacterium]|nr:DUF4175 domain-containing protein [Planctomycetota bacterium]
MWRSESHDQILFQIRRTKRLWRNTSITEGLLTFLLLLFALVLPLVLLESLFHFSAWIRIAFFVILVGVGAWAVVVYVFKPILAIPSDEEVALKIEAAFPETSNRVINTVRLGKDPLAQSRSMVGEVMIEAAQGVAGIDFDACVDRSRCIKRGAIVGALGLALMVFFAASPARFRNALSRILAPTSDIPAMGRVALGKVEPGDCELLAGSDLTIKAKIAGKGGEEYDAFVFFTPKDGRKRGYPLSPEGGGVYSYTMPGVRSSLRYYVEIGGTESRKYTVTIVRRPSVKRIGLSYRFPKYTGLEPVEVENSDGAIQAVKGTKVQLRIEATKDLREGTVEVTGGKTKELTVGVAQTILTGGLTVDRDYGYRIHLTDKNGYRNEDPVERFVTALPDGKPTVVIHEPGKDSEAPLGGKMQIVVRGTDDFGIAGARLLMKKGKTAEETEVANWADFADPKNVSITYAWPFPKEKFKAGDELTYWVEMVDTRPDPGPNTATSDKFIVKLIDIEQQRRDQTAKYKLWEKKLQEVLKQQRDARQQAGKLLGAPAGGKKK